MIHYQQLLPEQAGQLVDLVTACYGDSYPNSLLYDEGLLQKKLANKNLLSSVAYNDDDELIGHVGIYWEDNSYLTADATTAIILEAYQRQGILAELTFRMGDMMKDRVLFGLHSFAVTTHTASQKNGLQRGSYETGFLVPEFPATMYAKGVNSDSLGDCNPALTLYTPLQQPECRSCYVIPEYRDLLTEIYRRIKYERIFVDSDQNNVDDCDHEKTEFLVHYDQRKAVKRFEIKTLAGDWLEASEVIRACVKTMQAECLNGLYIDIPMTQPGADQLQRLLKNEGWYFGCILFERNSGDYLRMQYCNATIKPASLNLQTKFSHYLMQTVLAERDLNTKSAA